MVKKVKRIKKRVGSFFKPLKISASDALHRYLCAEKRVVVITGKENSNSFSVKDLKLNSWIYNESISVPDGMELVIRKVYNYQIGLAHPTEPSLEVVLRPYLVHPDSERFPGEPQ